MYSVVDCTILAMPWPPKSTYSSSPSGGEGGSGGGDDGEKAKDAGVAKMAGFVVFSGIAMSIIKSLSPKPLHPGTPPLPPPPPSPSPSPSPHRETSTSSKKPRAPKEEESASELRPRRTIEIVRGDTLWGLSRRHGVSVDAIREANGITGDTIYAGKKLIIP